MTAPTPTDPRLERLLDAVDAVLEDAAWFPSDQYATPEMLVATDRMNALRAAYAAYLPEDEPPA